MGPGLAISSISWTPYPSQKARLGSVRGRFGLEVRGYYRSFCDLASTGKGTRDNPFLGGRKVPLARDLSSAIPSLDVTVHVEVKKRKPLGAIQLQLHPLHIGNSRGW